MSNLSELDLIRISMLSTDARQVISRLMTKGCLGKAEIGVLSKTAMFLSDIKRGDIFTQSRSPESAKLVPGVKQVKKLLMVAHAFMNIDPSSGPENLTESLMKTKIVPRIESYIALLEDLVNRGPRNEIVLNGERKDLVEMKLFFLELSQQILSEVRHVPRPPVVQRASVSAGMIV